MSNNDINEKSDNTSREENDIDPGSISMEIARERIFGQLPTATSTETVEVAKALGRVLSTPIVSPLNVPPFRASAMDGYAYRHAEADKQLHISGRSLAGHPSADTAGAYECHRVTTGARVPDFADTVVQQENVELTGEKIKITSVKEKGFHVRDAGTDSAKGSALMEPGQRVAAAQLATLYSHGITHVDVFKTLRVAIFSTGDELRNPGDTLATGQIFESNRALIKALIASPAVSVIDLGIVEDTRDALQSVFEKCIDADVVISSGGVSVGDADYVRSELEKKGTLHMWKIAMKPGRPLSFGLLLDRIPFFGLPGNPVSSAVTCMMFVLPALQKLLGQTTEPLQKMSATLNGSLKKLPGRVEYQRGILIFDETSGWTVTTTGLQDSHVVTSLHKANCFVELAMQSNGAEAGELVAVIPFRQFSESLI